MAVRDIEGELRNRLRQEVSSAQIGELALRRLKEIDAVAYVRFASVYRAVRRRGGVRATSSRASSASRPCPHGQFPLDETDLPTPRRRPDPAPALPSGHCPGARGAPARPDRPGGNRWRLTRRPR